MLPPACALASALTMSMAPVHRVSAQAGRMVQCLHQVAFAQAGAQDEGKLRMLGDEAQVKQVLHLQPLDLGGPAPVEWADRLEHREAGVLDAALHRAVGAGGGLAGQQLGELVQVRTSACQRRCAPPGGGARG